MKKQHKISDLVELYRTAEQCDAEVFSEMRSNILLTSGNHWNRKNSPYWNRIREARTLTNETKLRLTKNHIYKISKTRENLLLTHSPGVGIFPAVESDSQSQKSAELNSSVWAFAKIQQNMRLKTQQFASDFFRLGECCAKIWWNPDGGEFKGYNQKVDDMGQPVVDEAGSASPDEDSPVFEGSLEIERIFAFNLLRDPDVQSMEESPWLMIRKIVKVDTLKQMFEEDDERRRFVTEGKNETYVIFDANKQNYQKEKGITTLKEIYFKPSPCYPMGYYYIFVDGGILFEGELPYSVFPIAYEGHDETATTARHRSPIKQLRPYQVEINRAASSQAEIGLTLGQDKIILQAGAKLTPGEVLPGVRAYHSTGRDPTILEGRTGLQWTDYITQNITEMYNIAMIPEDAEEKQETDPWAELFKSMKQKKKFVMDAEKFEGFLCKITNIYLDLARHYYPDDMLIPQISKSEAVNISEFRNTEKLSYRIKAEPMGDDLHSSLGRVLMINHVLQYASNSMDKDDIGKLIRLMPFANVDKSFEDLTLDSSRAENIILALDRGQAPDPNNSDKGPYIIKKLSNRMAKADFQFLHSQIQENYKNMIAVYEQLEAEKARQLKAMESDFIPTDGAQIKVAWYIKDPTNPSRSVQATLPANAIQWLVERLSDQSGLTTPNSKLSTGDQAAIAGFYKQSSAQTEPVPPSEPNNQGMLQ